MSFRSKDGNPVAVSFTTTIPIYQYKCMMCQPEEKHPVHISYAICLKCWEKLEQQNQGIIGTLKK